VKRAGDPLVDLSVPASWQARRPLLIAHRGGPVGPGSPENSRAGILGAAERGYDLVELDVRASNDGQPFLFHGDWTRTLRLACGVDRRPEELTLVELRDLRYRATDQHVLGLDDALTLCAELHLGVMLDMKVEVDPAVVERVVSLVEAHGLAGASMTISTHPTVRAACDGRIMLRATQDEIASGQLAGRMWFGHAEDLPDEAVAAHQRAGAIVVPSINVFHYTPHAHMELAGADISRLARAGVEAFQIDDVYRDFVPSR
jgi:glycerophosphoryl diester phosphodiesterase